MDDLIIGKININLKFKYLVLEIFCYWYYYNQKFLYLSDPYDMLKESKTIINQDGSEDGKRCQLCQMCPILYKI